MFLSDETADAIELSIESDSANVIQTARHRRPATPRVRRGIVFFIERLIDKPIRISANYVHFSGHVGNGHFAAGMRKWCAVMPASLALQRWQLRPARPDSMLLGKHQSCAKEKSD